MERHTKRVVVMSKLIDIISQMPEEIKKEDLVEKILGMESYPLEYLNTHHSQTRNLKSTGHCVYAIKLGSVEKLYIGTSYNYPKRIASHLRALREGTHHSALMQKTYNDNGFCDSDVTVFIIRDNLTFEEAYRIESAYIKYYDTTNPEHGYNTSAGSSAGGVLFIDGAPILL